jgi:hypothetical protein
MKKISKMASLIHKYHNGDFSKRVILIEKNNTKLQSAINTWNEIQKALFEPIHVDSKLYEWKVESGKANNNDDKN